MSRFNVKRYFAPIVIALTALTFARCIGNDFINFDDDLYITDNPMVAGGLSLAGLRWAFTTAHGALWAPLAWLSHMADASLFGLHPAGHHAVNVLFHALNAGLAYLLFRRWRMLAWPAFFATLFWSLHPLRVESVAWAAERKDVLSLFFALLSLLAYDTFAHRHSWRAYAAAFLALALGLLSKPMLVTLPCVFLLLDLSLYGRARAWPRVLAEKLPFAALSAAAIAITLWAQRDAVQPLDILTLDKRILLAVQAYGAYLKDTFFTEQLSVLYPLKPDQLTLASAIIPVAVLTLITVGMLWKWRTRALRTGWLFFLGTLVPVSGIIPIGNHARADRFTYLPSLGLALIVAYCLSRLEATPTRYRWLFRVLAAALIFPLFTWQQLGHWQNSGTLFSHAIHCDEENSIAYNNLGRYQIEHGEALDGLRNIEEAVRFAPGNMEALFNLGAAYLAAGLPDKAVATLGPLTQALPTDPALNYNLALALHAVGDPRFPIAAQNALSLLPPNTPESSQILQLLQEAPPASK